MAHRRGEGNLRVGGQHQGGEADPRPVGQRHFLCRPVDALDPRIEAQTGADLVVERRRLDAEPVGRELAGEDFLGERRTLIGQVRLVADQRHLTCVAVL